MGDYILMKTLTIILFFLLVNQLDANELSWVDEQVQAIQPSRVGITDKEIARLKDPFIFLILPEKNLSDKKGVKAKRVKRHVHYVKKHYTRKLHLDAILNKSVMINKRWYKEGQRVYGYKIVKVQRTAVLLQKQNKKLLLSTVSKSKNLKLHNK